MKSFRRAISAVIAMAALVLTLLFSTSVSASASSDYDDLLHTTPTLSVYTDGATKSQTMDISNSWWKDLQQSYERRLQYSNWPPNFVARFQDILDAGGSWGIFSQETPSGNVLALYGTEDPNATCEFTNISGSDWFTCTTGPNYNFLRAEYITHSSYGSNGCGVYGVNVCSDNGMAFYQEPAVYNGNMNSRRFVMMPVNTLDIYEFYAWNFDMTYPSDYEGVVLPQQPTLDYVALGDSFSSGEGVEPFLSGTDTGTPNENRCHRSEKAYPRLLDQDNSQKVNLEMTAFVACSGATTSNVTTTGQWGEPAQIDALGSSTEIVTLTIGGNDIGFNAFATACVTNVCDEDSAIYSSTVTSINSVGGDLEEAYEEILSRIAPTGQLYVMNYPMMVPMDMEWDDPSNLICPYMMAGTGVDTVYSLHANRWGNARGAQDVISRLNAAIEEAVYTVSLTDSRVHYVDVSTDFIGHDVCSFDPQFIVNQLPPATFHPNESAQQTMATAMSDAMS